MVATNQNIANDLRLVLGETTAGIRRVAIRLAGTDEITPDKFSWQQGLLTAPVLRA